MASCCMCPAKIDDEGLDTADFEDLHGWTFSREAAEWVCDCCYAEEERRIEAEFGWMRSHVKRANEMRRAGDTAEADMLAFAVAGVR